MQRQCYVIFFSDFIVCLNYTVYQTYVVTLFHYQTKYWEVLVNKCKDSDKSISYWLYWIFTRCRISTICHHSILVYQTWSTEKFWLTSKETVISHSRQWLYKGLALSSVSTLCRNSILVYQNWSSEMCWLIVQRQR